MKRQQKKKPARRQRALSLNQLQIRVVRALERSYLPLVPLGMH